MVDLVPLGQNASFFVSHAYSPEQSNDSDKFLTNSHTVKTTKMISKNKHFHKRPKTKKKFSELDSLDFCAFSKNPTNSTILTNV